MKDIEPSWPALRLLAAIDEEHGLIRAAQHVGMSQSAASHALAKLERSLSVSLVSRDRLGLRLSETGKRLLPHVNQALRALDAIRDEVAQLSALQKGSLRIAAVPSLAGTWVPRLIREFQLKFPAVEISLFEGTDNEVAEWVQTRVAHAGFAALPVKGLSTIAITRDEWMAVLPPKDPAPRMTLGALSKRKFLLSGGGCEDLIRSLFEEASLDLPQSRLLIKQMATIEAMVSEGLGVSLVPATALAQSKKVRTVPLSPKRYRSIGLLLPPGPTHSPLVSAWTSVVHKHFQHR